MDLVNLALLPTNFNWESCAISQHSNPPSTTRGTALQPNCSSSTHLAATTHIETAAGVLLGTVAQLRSMQAWLLPATARYTQSKSPPTPMTLNLKKLVCGSKQEVAHDQVRHMLPSAQLSWGPTHPNTWFSTAHTCSGALTSLHKLYMCVSEYGM